MSALGFVGYPGTGKDAIGQELVANFGYERIAFGDPVKEMLLQVDPVYADDYAVLDRYKRQRKHFTREKLQNLGQLMREMDKDHWIRKIEEIGIPKRAIFTDIRYFNELAYVQRNCGGLIIGIKRDGCRAVNGHQSEQNTGKLYRCCDTIYDNRKTIEEAAKDIAEYAENRIRL